MIANLYAVCFLLSMVFLVFLAVVGQKQNITNFLLLFVAVMIVILGYFTISIAPSLIVAIRGNNLVYLGNVFTPLLLYLSITKLCHRRIPHGLFFFLLLLAGIILFLSLGITDSNIFYRNLWLVKKNDISFLGKEYGPAHALFPVNLALCMVLSMWTLVRSWKKQEDVSWKVIACLFVAGLLAVGCYALKRIFQTDIELPVLGYLADELLILFLIRRIGMYEVSDSIARVLEEHSTYGYLIFDNRLNYLGCNDRAKQYLPEIRKQHIDHSIQPADAFLYENIAIKLEAPAEDQPYYISRDNMELRCSVSPLYHGMWNRKVGFIVTIEDDTQRQNYICLLRSHNAELEEARQKADDANHAKSDFLSSMSHEIRTPMNTIVGMTEILLRAPHSAQTREYLLNIRNSGNALLSIINDILDFSKIESGKLEIIEEEYEPMSMLSDLAMIFLNRIGEKDIELLFDIDPALPVKLYGDALRLRQVIINLTNNAIKFTDSGFVCLTMRTEKTKDGFIELFVSVKDSGQGIKAEEINHLFESFSQADTRKNHHKEGTGLGLSISRQLVEMMGGQIHVSSEYGGGSEFTFTLLQKVINPQQAAQIKKELSQTVSGRMKTQHAMNMLKKLVSGYGLEFVEDSAKSDFFFTDSMDLLTGEEKERLQNSKTTVCLLQNPMTENIMDAESTVLNKPLYSLNFCQIMNHDLQGLSTDEENIMNFTAEKANILLVDDNEMNIKVALGLLEPLHMQFDTASNGKQALEMAQKKQYDLIFMDHMMPVMDGIEAVQRLRQMQDSPCQNVPVIALTANAIVDAKAGFLKAGMNDFISKPIKLKEICAVIRKYLPAELITETEENRTNLFIKEQPEIAEEEIRRLESAGLDVAEGIRNSGSLELFLNLLGDFYKLIDLKATKIEKCLADGMIRDYTIEVHALKNTARMIGAVQLSEQFYRMEQYGNEENREALDANTAEVLRLYRSYKSVLKPYGVQSEGKKQASAEEITASLQALENAIENFDLDTADETMKQLEEYQFPEDCQQELEELRAYVADVAMENIIEVTRSLVQKLTKH